MPLLTIGRAKISPKGEGMESAVTTLNMIFRVVLFCPSGNTSFNVVNKIKNEDRLLEVWIRFIVGTRLFEKKTVGRK
jgi:hypothetical protein